MAFAIVYVVQEVLFTYGKDRKRESTSLYQGKIVISNIDDDI